MHDDGEGHGVQWFFIIVGLAMMTPVLIFGGEDRWVGLMLLIFPIFPAFMGLFLEDGKPDSAVCQRNQDLEWWIAESENAESPFYRHVCEDMVTYLQDTGATPPHPSFKDGVRLAKPGQRPNLPPDCILTKEDLDYVRRVYGR